MNIDEIAVGAVVLLVVACVAAAAFGFIMGMGYGERRAKGRTPDDQTWAEEAAWERGHQAGRNFERAHREALDS